MGLLPSNSFPTNPADPCYPQQQCCLASHSHFQSHHPPPPTSDRLPYAQLFGFSPSVQLPNDYPDSRAHRSSIVSTDVMPATASVLSSALPISPLELEASETTRSAFEGHKSSIPSSKTGSRATRPGRKHVVGIGIRQRIPMACTNCRKRKIRCDGAEICAACSPAGRVCKYTPIPVAQSKLEQVRRVLLGRSDKRRSPPPSVARADYTTSSHHRPTGRHPYTPTGDSIVDDSFSAAVGHPIAPYGGDANIPAWSSGFITPPTHGAQPTGQHRELAQVVTASISKPFPSVLMPPNSYAIASAGIPPISNKAYSYLWHSSAHFPQSGRPIAFSSVSPPHTPLPQLVLKFASRPHPVVDVAPTPLHHSHSSSPSHGYQASGTSA